MKPPAMQISLTTQEPGEGWHFCVLRRGVTLAGSEGETFPNAGLALKAAIEEAQASIRAIQGQQEGEGVQ